MFLSFPSSGSRSRTPESVAVASVYRHQFQVLQQRAGIRHELDMPTTGARQNGMARTGREARTHELIALEFLLTSQTAYGLTVRIGGDTGRRLDGWFHTFLENEMWSSPLGLLHALGRV